MFFEHEPRFYESGTDGPAPVAWHGANAVDGDAHPWVRAPLGSIYLQRTTAVARAFQKVAASGRDDDWSALGGMHVISQRVTRSQFTDGGSAVGTLTMNQAIPAGALVLRVLAENVTGFAGDTSAVLDVGDGTDDDRYNASAGLNVFADAVAVDGGAPQGTQVHIAAKTPVLTLTSAADFTNVSAGAMTVKIFYML